MYSVGDKVVYPHHGAGKIMKIEQKEVLGQQRDYLTIQILHNDMTVMVPVENADRAGLRKVVEADVVDQVLEVLRGDPTKMPKNWSRRYKHNRDKLKTGDIFEVAEVVRNLAIRHAIKGLSTGEKQMFSKAKKILASELMYARDFSEDEANAFLEEVLENIHVDGLLRLSTNRSSRPPSSDGRLPADEGAQAAEGVLAPAVRTVLALLGALAGYQLADRILASSFAPELDQPGKIVWLLVFTLAGLGIGYLFGVAALALRAAGLSQHGRGHGERLGRRGRGGHRRRGGRPRHRHAHQHRPGAHPASSGRTSPSPSTCSRATSPPTWRPRSTSRS